MQNSAWNSLSAHASNQHTQIMQRVHRENFEWWKNIVGGSYGKILLDCMYIKSKQHTVKQQEQFPTAQHKYRLTNTHSLFIYNTRYIMWDRRVNEYESFMWYAHNYLPAEKRSTGTKSHLLFMLGRVHKMLIMYNAHSLMWGIPKNGNGKSYPRLFRPFPFLLRVYRAPCARALSAHNFICHIDTGTSEQANARTRGRASKWTNEAKCCVVVFVGGEYGVCGGEYTMRDGGGWRFANETRYFM